VKTKVTRSAIVCDGCGYIIPGGERQITLTVRKEVFDFCDGGEGAAEKHDCFRYWAHGPRIMRRSLEERDWDDERIEEFLSLMLYRGEGWLGGPGVPREPVEA
jgi:hypothetical protein